MSQPGIPLRYRLAVRQTVPILAGLVGVLFFLIAMGYLHAREQIIDTARLQVAQLVGSIARQDDYSRRWLERGMQSVARLAATFPGLSPRQRLKLDKRMVGIISDERGKQTVEICLLNRNGSLWLRRYDSAGVLPPTAPDAPTGQEHLHWPEWTAQSLRELKTAQWHRPVVGHDRAITISYSVPLMKKEHTGGEAVAGVCTVSLGMSWFADRVRSFSSFENCVAFFFTPHGRWTLPPEADDQLAHLKRQMTDNVSGERNVTYDGEPYLAVFMPVTDGSLRMGVLIPRDHLFGNLDRLTRLLGLTGLVILVLAAYSLHRTSARLLKPLGPLGTLAARLARGELEAPQDATAALPPPFPDEAQRLKIVTEKLRQDLSQREHDLTLIGKTRERLFGELDFARSLQEKLRPQKLPPIEGLEVAAFVHTAGDVCGDLYNYFLQSPRRLCCVMGNVAERGVPAALLMGRMGPLLHELLLAGLSPGKALESINRVLAPAGNAPSSMVSVLTSVLDLDSGVFHWACAGQLPPFHICGSTVQQLEWTGNVPLGIRTDEKYEEKTLQLAPGESLLFAGQRLLSMVGAEGGLYTEVRLRQFLQTHAEPLPELLRLLYGDIRDALGGAPQDDLTFFSIRWRGGEAAGATLSGQKNVNGRSGTPCVCGAPA